MAYFFTWRLHGNRVSKTRFISLINKIKSERNHQNIKEEPRKKKKNPETDKIKLERNHQNIREEPRKKKKPPETKRERRSRSEIGVGGFRPLCAT